MNISKEILQNAVEKLSSESESVWKETALAIFRWQASHNEIYRKYLSYLRVNPEKIQTIEKIPFLPIRFFKEQIVITGSFSAETIFESSRTTGQIPSKHYIRDLSLYHRHTVRLFEMFYGKLSNYHLFALLPSYLERPNSSLVSMVSAFMKHTAQPSGFYLAEWEQLSKQVRYLLQQGKKVIILGVTFALLDWAESAPTNLQGAILMETGGMKGKRKEIIRQELHDILQKAFSIKKVHAEYGMTELLSQAYSTGDGWFKMSPFFRILLRDLYDPFDITHRKTGGINIIDLANLDSCCFIETQDIGTLHADKQSFQILGRADNTDTRGCNLMVF
ncbi:MAG: acyl transferase [Cytophagales bacterium]|nr:acyl transferase [Cytophagales bacterium]MDW8383925.1 acyl transferase [Flammeovirgaceae bacterium]